MERVYYDQLVPNKAYSLKLSRSKVNAVFTLNVIYSEFEVSSCFKGLNKKFYFLSNIDSNSYIYQKTKVHERILKDVLASFLDSSTASILALNYF